VVPRRPPSDLTDDPNCPNCDQEGRLKPNSCKRHDWAYRVWFEGLRRGVAQ
jgi:hypothetical protein